jgi:predicted transcriptional regulator
VAEILDKKGVLICFSTTESVVDMSHHQIHFVAVPESMEEMAESDRIRATGHSDHNQIA